MSVSPLTTRGVSRIATVRVVRFSRSQPIAAARTRQHQGKAIKVKGHNVFTQTIRQSYSIFTREDSESLHSGGRAEPIPDVTAHVIKERVTADGWRNSAPAANIPVRRRSAS